MGWVFVPSMRAELVEVPRESPFDRLRAHNGGLRNPGQGSPFDKLRAHNSGPGKRGQWVGWSCPQCGLSLSKSRANRPPTGSGRITAG
jgi:hypothetical protein